MLKKLLYNLNLIEETHLLQPFVYCNKDNKDVNYITDNIRWLDKVQVIKCKKKHLQKELNKLEKKYIANNKRIKPSMIHWW